MTAQKKKHTIALICLLFATVAVIFAGVLMLRENPQKETVGGLSDNLSFAEAVTTTNESYVLREYNGIIGVFRADGTLYDVINVPVVALPSVERERLASGVSAPSPEALAALIEDYSG